MKRFTRGAFFGNKPSKPYSDIKQHDVTRSLEHWPAAKNENQEPETDDYGFVIGVEKKRPSRPWIAVQNEERPSRTSTTSLAERRAARSAQRPPVSSTASGGSKSRNHSVDNLRTSAKRKFSNLFGGGAPSRTPVLSASAGAVNASVSEDNFLTPYYVRHLLAEEEKRNGETPHALASGETSVHSLTNGHTPKARLAEPEPSLSDDSDREDYQTAPITVVDPVSIPETAAAATLLPEATKADLNLPSSAAPKPLPAKSSKPKKEKKSGGFLGLFKRRVESVMPASSAGGGSAKRKVSITSTRSSSDSGEDGMKSAFYNVAAFGMAACCILAAFAAYYLFCDFVKPAMWAVICGIVLYPLKRRVTTVVRAWLDQLSVTGTPLMLGVVALPLNITNGWGEFLLDSATNNLKTVLLMVTAFPASALLLHFETIPRVLVTTKQALIVIDQLMGAFKAVWVPVVLLIYIIYVCLSNIFGARSSILCHPAISWTLWIAGLGHVCSYFGPLRTLAFSLVLILCTTYYIPFIQGLPSPTRLLPPRRGRSAKRPATLTAASLRKPKHFGLFNRKTIKEDPAGASMLESPEKEALLEHEPAPEPETVPKEPDLIETQDAAAVAGSESNTYLKRLFIACFFVYVSLHLWMMLLLIFPIGVALIRRLAVMFDLHAILRHQWHRLRSTLGDDTRLILPPPLVHFLRVLVHIDRQVIYYLRQSMDFVGSLTAMLLLMIGVALMTSFVLFQLYHESVHVVHLSANIANQTLAENPALQKWLRETVQVDSVAELAEEASKRAMSVARNWLSAQVHEIVENDPEKAALLEAQIVNTVDTLFETLWQKNETNETDVFASPAMQHQKTAMAQWADTWTAIGETGSDLDWNFLDHMQEYLRVAWSVADSAWLIIKNNMEVLMIAMTQIGSTLLASGSAVVDFFLDSIVFLTFLLYVLSESDDEYKPMRMIRDLVPGGRDTASTITEQVEEAVNGVFFATSKIAIFYGMLTWLTHTLFAVSMVFIPSVLAALFAAIPFFGAYLIALPAVLELWVIRGEPFLAVLLFLLHYIPSYIVDDAIYSEITLTTPLLSGMAIAGGILWWGLEGAIFGPLVLCFILVLGGVYKKICFETMDLSSGASTPAGGVSRTGSVILDQAPLDENVRHPNGDVLAHEKSSVSQHVLIRAVHPKDKAKK